MVCRGDLLLNPPFYCDFGYNIEVGCSCLFNYNCTIIDVGKVKIGDFCLLGPNVSVYTAGHPVHPAHPETNIGIRIVSQTAKKIDYYNNAGVNTPIMKFSRVDA